MKKTRKAAGVVAVGELKVRLSEYLRQVKAGGELIVTERGRPIARITPLAASAASGSRVQELLASGAVRPATRVADAGVWRRPRPADPSGRSLEILLEERAEGR